VQLVKPDDPILHTICPETFVIQVETVQQMFDLLAANQGLGLAAPQVGINARLFVTAWGEVFVNPQIVHGEGTIRCHEGCLSLPGVDCFKRRAARITLADGRTYERLKAIVIQHETDHLNGVLITDE
jgi:peptide deformylase